MAPGRIAAEGCSGTGLGKPWIGVFVPGTQYGGKSVPAGIGVAPSAKTAGTMAAGSGTAAAPPDAGFTMRCITSTKFQLFGLLSG